MEVVKCIQCFLNLRSRVIEPLNRQQSTSQDDYGMDDMDFNDPALNNMIGYGDVQAVGSDNLDVSKREKDEAFASVSSSYPL